MKKTLNFLYNALAVAVIVVICAVIPMLLGIIVALAVKGFQWTYNLFS